MKDEIEAMLRKLYADFSRGDIEAVLAACSDDIRFHVPGRSQVAGEYTKATFGELIGKVMQLSGGTFREDAVEVLAGDSFGAVYLLHHFERDGKAVAYHTIHLWRAREGRLAEWWEYPQDLYAFDEAWS